MLAFGFAVLRSRSLFAQQADILKVGHHGSKNFTTLSFLDAVQPILVMIPAGEDNPYGHPSPARLARLQQASVPVLRTDQSAAIHIATDGVGFEVSCFVECGQATAQANLRRPDPPDQQQNEKEE